MIVVDTSAIVAILKRETEARRCLEVLAQTDEAVMSAGTFLEVQIVSEANDMADLRDDLIRSVSLRIEPVTAALARGGGLAWRRYGRGRHPAGLNFGDCFAYALADALNAPLLFVGEDFTKTDLRSA